MLYSRLIYCLLLCSFRGLPLLPIPCQQQRCQEDTPQWWSLWFWCRWTHPPSVYRSPESVRNVIRTSLSLPSWGQVTRWHGKQWALRVPEICEAKCLYVTFQLAFCSWGCLMGCLFLFFWFWDSCQEMYEVYSKGRNNEAALCGMFRQTSFFPAKDTPQALTKTYHYLCK